MAVFTPVSDDQARAFLETYDLGAFRALHPIAEGVENTNYRLETEGALYVLTLFEARIDAASLPFCLGLTDHLAGRGFPAPRPVRNRDGVWVGTLNGRPAAVIEWLSGAWLRDPSPSEVEAAGAMLGRLHLEAGRFAVARVNPVGPVAWRALADRCQTAATGEDRSILDGVEAALIRLGDPWTDDLPRGPIHADYFPDNVLFDEGAVSGVIDFYFGCTDLLAYDLAIALSAWGFDGTGTPIPGAVEAFRRGYERLRPLTPAEAAALPRLGEAAAIRFTLTRLHDRIFHDPTKLVTPKDPGAFFRRAAWWRETA
ncbi:homoserine kinase [Brevundimonas subvibrioides]|uniref:homoserine kinase n=1 Tax=Brevundimonas subvibrioides TaxID=74313 RepID=UPI0022B4BB4F|nr:homoserine kinase [Brevundimonas subvibrioides]